MSEKVTFNRNDHHFVLDTGVVITIPASLCDMFTAAEYVNEMLAKLDPEKYASKQYGWAMQNNGYFLKFWPKKS